MGSSLEQGVASCMVGELRLVATPTDLAAAREFVQRAAMIFGLGPEASFELVLAANEAVTNAIRHGGVDDEGKILLFTFADGERLTLGVRDYGTFREPAAPRLDGGRGLAMMRSLSDHFELQADPLGTTVRLSKDRG
jgi:anti-sigma regulatory factor (Ser/Thr protein kinase)